MGAHMTEHDQLLRTDRVLAAQREAAGAQGTDVLFQGLLEAAPDAIVIVGGDGRIVLVNRQTEALFGFGREDLLGQPIEILVPERFRQGHVAYRDQYIADPRTRPMGHGRELY